ncbi:MAG: DUF2007 domain-containing protein [Deltaproteobacteria bacterium]|nr:DUF2007 domain-containing protein [Deltaproteobacteria bacterium]
MRRLVRTRQSVEGQLLYQYLTAHGLRCELRNEFAAQVIPLDAIMVEIWVETEDFPEASSILTSASAADDSGLLSLVNAEPEPEGNLSVTATDERACPRCQERSPSHFGECWNCQNSLVEPEDAR